MSAIDSSLAEFARLQIVLLRKIERGQITPSQLESFIDLRDDTRAAVLKSGLRPTPTDELTKMFVLLVDLGIVTVHEGYEHDNALYLFRGRNHKGFEYYNPDFSDTHFPHPSRVLKPGDRFRVRVFSQVTPDLTTSEERMAFLAMQGAFHAGAQGASLVWEQKRSELPRALWYSSFDEKSRLWYYRGDYMVPDIGIDPSGAVTFDLGNFGIGWGQDSAFLCFSDV